MDYVNVVQFFIFLTVLLFRS